MHRELLAQSPLLILPLAAMFLFLAVFVAVAIRVTLTHRDELDTAARMPLGEDHDPS
jgi:hypothetical protein